MKARQGMNLQAHRQLANHATRTLKRTRLENVMRIHQHIARAVASVLVLLQGADAADLSPAKWNPVDKKRAEASEMSPFPSQARIIEGSAGIISNTGSPIAVHAGMEALKQGGTAADAAATVALTQVTTWLGSIVSYGGVLHLVYFEARTGKIYSLDAGWNSYRGESDARSIPAPDPHGLGVNQTSTNGAAGRKTLVPGFMAGVEAMHKRFGRLPFAQLFQPAIWYAENGVTVTPVESAWFASYGKILSRTPEGRQFLRQAGNDLPKIGDRFVQADVAKTLRGVARHGAGYMYTGPWGEQFVAAVRREDGKVTMEDMKSYRPLWEEPLSTTFGDATVVGPGKSNEATHQVLEALNLISELHLDQTEPYWKDPTVFRKVSQVLQLTQVAPFGNPEISEYQHKHGFAFSPDDRITKAYAKAMAPMVGELQDTGTAPQGSHHSAGTVVIDRWGNVAAIVHTIEDTGPWGSTGIVVGGIPLSGIAGLERVLLATIKPGERLPGLPTPMLVMSGNKPVLALAAVGISEIPEIVRVVLGTAGNHLDLQAVIAAPPLLANHETPQPGESHIWKRLFVPEGAYDAEFLGNLEASGVKVQQKTQAQARGLRGTTAVVTIDPRTGVRRSVENPAIIGFADAY
jgi:gamma-glutamyltranspeptidase/glutathione hydrolase